MSRYATPFRPLARMGWGGNAATHWRGLLSGGNDALGMPIVDPQVIGPSWQGQIGTVVYRSPGGVANFRLAGVTRDSGANAVGGCRVELFLTATDTPVATTVSDTNGNFVFDGTSTGPFYMVAYKAGGTDLAGTTVNTLTPVAS